jgi:hypothetical protein
MSVGRPRRSRLKVRGNTVAILGQNSQIVRQLRRHILSSHCLARIDGIASWATTDKERTLKNTSRSHWVKALTWLELDKKVNAVLESRLPLVD